MKDQEVKVRMTAEDKQCLQDYAKARRLSLAAFIRFAVFQYCRRYDK